MFFLLFLQPYLHKSNCNQANILQHEIDTQIVVSSVGRVTQVNVGYQLGYRVGYQGTYLAGTRLVIIGQELNPRCKIGKYLG